MFELESPGKFSISRMWSASWRIEEPRMSRPTGNGIGASSRNVYIARGTSRVAASRLIIPFVRRRACYHPPRASTDEINSSTHRRTRNPHSRIARQPGNVVEPILPPSAPLTCYLSTVPTVLHLGSRLSLSLSLPPTRGSACPCPLLQSDDQVNVNLSPAVPSLHARFLNQSWRRRRAVCASTFLLPQIGIIEDHLVSGRRRLGIDRGGSRAAPGHDCLAESSLSPKASERAEEGDEPWNRG